MNILKELYSYREMIAGLVRRELRGKYKGSVLGFLWTFINPLLQLIVYTVVFSTILKAEIDKFYLFLFVALIPWIFFSSSLVGGSSCILNQKSMVSKIYFPREVLPISYVTTNFINMLLCFIIVLVVVLISGVKIMPLALLYLPVIAMIEYLMALGFTFVSASLTVYFRDLEHILSIISMAWMYLTPIMYSIDIIPEKYQFLFLFNPMTPIITAYRDVLYYGRMPYATTLLQAFLFGVLILTIGFFIFGKLKRNFAEEL